MREWMTEQAPSIANDTSDDKIMDHLNFARPCEKDDNAVLWPRQGSFRPAAVARRPVCQITPLAPHNTFRVDGCDPVQFDRCQTPGRLSNTRTVAIASTEPVSPRDGTAPCLISRCDPCDSRQHGLSRAPVCATDRSPILSYPMGPRRNTSHRHCGGIRPRLDRTMIGTTFCGISIPSV